MARPDKAIAVAELADNMRSATATVLTEYRGLTVAQLRELRSMLGVDTSYVVVKNTLAKIAAADAGLSGIDGLLAGPSALAVVRGDVVEAAKGLRKFAKENKALVIKGGVMDGAVLSAADIETLADLESREVLLAKLAGAMQGTLTQAVSLFAAPLAQAARAVEALRAKVEAEASRDEPAETDTTADDPAVRETASTETDTTADDPAATTVEASSESPSAGSETSE